MLGRLASHAGVWFMRLLAGMLLPCLRRLGWLLGRALYVVARSRRFVADAAGPAVDGAGANPAALVR